MAMDYQIPDGIYAASLTPLNADQSICHKAFAQHVQWLLSHGCDGVVLMGTTGEATSFSVSERQAAIERLLSSGLPRDRLMVGTGCAAVSDTIALTRHALACGIKHVLTLPPFYYKKPSNDGLYAAFDQQIQVAGDADLRIYLYHFPQMSAVPLSNALIARLRAAYPRCIAGFKDSSGDLRHMLAVMAEFPGLRFFAGTEQFLLPVLEAGGSGCISATINITCSLAQRLYRHGHGTGSSALLEEITGIRRAVEAHPVIPGLKSIMAQLSREPKWRQVRPPHMPLGAAGARALAPVAMQVARSLRHA